LPPIETACATGADCDHSYVYELDGKCCDATCSPKPVNRAYMTKIAEVCKKAGHADESRCGDKKCAKPPDLACVSGQCRAK
jgi:hypothetical protein